MSAYHTTSFILHLSARLPEPEIILGKLKIILVEWLRRQPVDYCNILVSQVRHVVYSM